MIQAFYYFSFYFQKLKKEDYMNLFHTKNLNKFFLELIEAKIKELDSKIKDINNMQKDNDEIEKIKDSLKAFNLMKKNWNILVKKNFYNLDEKNIIYIKSILDENIIKDKFLNTNLENLSKKMKINEEIIYYYKKGLYYTFGLTLFLMSGFLFFIYLVIVIKKTKIL